MARGEVPVVLGRKDTETKGFAGNNLANTRGQPARVPYAMCEVNNGKSHT